jgi:glycosyltransferase involved in cell wall biosynthesis
MKILNFDGPINPLSLGNVSVNFLKELYKKEIETRVFPTNNKIDTQAFNKLDSDFSDWLKNSYNSRLKKFTKEIPTLKVWHINGSERTLGENQYLYTFYEVDSPTEEEISIVKSQKHVFFSSSESANFFKEKGCDNVSYVPLGFDQDFFVTDKKYLDDDVIHFGIIGKFEKRKNTSALINIWARKFGNNPKYQLTCLVNNQFIGEEKQREAINLSLGGRKFNNINILSTLKTNEEVNELMNAIDIDLSGLSNGEGWNLPSFNCSALGKWSIVTNSSSHKDWANEKNSILVEPTGRQNCYDNMFFREGDAFNQGQYSKIDEKGVIDGIERALKVAKQENTEGLKLQKQFTYAKSIDKILTKIF